LDDNFFRENDGEWEEEEKLEAHSDWVRDVAWAPNIGLPTSKIASCSQASFTMFIPNCFGKMTTNVSQWLCVLFANESEEEIVWF
jgi:hypothetical protein